jgi:Ca-activated chloride channel family protein
MNCTQAGESLPLHLAGELGEEGELLSHLALCEPCARRAELSQMAWDLAGLAPEQPVPDAAIQRLYDAIDRSRRRPRRLYLTLLRLGTVAAAAVLVLAWLSPGAVRPPAQPAEMPCQGAPELMDAAFGRLEAGDEGGRGPLGLRSHAVTVAVDDWTMRTEVEEVFFNASDRRLEGTFTFPLPADASLSRFAMEVEGKLVEGELVERTRAREVYEGIVRSMRDPALLEWMPGNVFKARIFPIEPWSPKRVILAYTQAPRVWNGALQYVYPLVSEKTREHPPEALSVRADFRFARPIERLECAGRQADVARRDARSARVELALRNARPEENFHVRVELETEELAVAAHRPAGEDGFLGAAFAPRLPEAEAAAGPVVFVVDRSARMAEAELEIARRVVERMIARLPGADRVALLAHHLEVSEAPAGPVTDERREEWSRFLRDLRGEGASDVLSALRAAAAAGPAGATVIYVGKGVPTWGETEGGRLVSEAVSALRGRAFRAVLIGTGANEPSMSTIAGVRDGAVQSIVPGGDTEAEIAAVARTVAVRPVQEVRLEAEGVELRQVAPARRPAVFPGERVFLFARYGAEGSPRRAKITVRGYSGGRRVERAVEIELPSGPTEYGPLVRLWAQRALAERVGECQRRGEPAEEVAAIVGMSRKFQVMTPYTSFLVLENEEAYRQYRIDRADRREEERRPEEEQKDRRWEGAVPARDLPRLPTVEDDRSMKESLVRHQQMLVEIDNAFAKGVRAFNRGEYDTAERDLRRILEYAKWMPTGVELETRRRQAEALLARTREARRDFPWRELLPGRLPKGISALDEEVVPGDREILHQIRTLRITVEMREAPLSAVVDRIRELSGLNIQFVGVDFPDRQRVSIVVRDVALEDAFRLFLEPRGLAHAVREGVVLITRRAEAARLESDRGIRGIRAKMKLGR